MKPYRITAVVDTVTLKSDYGDWHGSLDIPPFTVSAASENDALVKAKLIVDPLRMTVTHITAQEIAGEQNLSAIRRWAEHELTLLEGSAVRNPGQEQAIRTVLHRIATGDWSHGEDES